MRLQRSFTVFACLVAWLCHCPAMESEVPDPYGLGERLALIAWLQDHSLPIEDPTDISRLRQRFSEALAPAPDEEWLHKLAETKRLLWIRHSVLAVGQDLSALEAELLDLDRRQTQTHADLRVAQAMVADASNTVPIPTHDTGRANQEQRRTASTVDTSSAWKYSRPTPVPARTSTGFGTAENGDRPGVDNDGDGRVEPVHVRGYYRKDGTYVRGHYRASPRR